MRNAQKFTEVLRLINKVGTRLRGHDAELAQIKQAFDTQLAINAQFERRIKSLEQALDNGLPLY